MKISIRGSITQSDLCLAPSEEPAVHSLREPKYCEWCGRGFYRRVPERSNLGEKVCGNCRKKAAEEKAANANIPLGFDAGKSAGRVGVHRQLVESCDDSASAGRSDTRVYRRARRVVGGLQHTNGRKLSAAHRARIAARTLGLIPPSPFDGIYLTTIN